MSRRREQVAYCYCYTKCTLGDGPPRKVQRRTRAQHLESDRHELRPAHLHGIEPSPLLVKAIDITSSAITADDDDDSSSAEQSASDESGSLGSEAASNAFPGPVGHPSDDLDQSVPFAFDGGDVDQGLFEGDSSDGADSRTDEEAEMRIIDPMDVDEDLISDLDSQDEGSVQEGDLVAADLPLFVRGHDSSDGEDEDSDSQDEDIVDQDDARPEHPDGQDEAPRAEQDRQNNEPRSRYSQQLLDDLTGDYSPGPCPQGPPRASERLLSAADLSPSQQATLNQFRTFVRKDLTVDAYIETARNTEKAANGVKIMSKFKAAKFAKRITKLEENVWDMCPQSCMAFVGPHAHLRRCNTIRDGQRCGAERYNSNNKAKRTFTTIPILPRARAKWAAGTGSIYAQERATQAEQNLRPGVADPRHVFLDFGDGAVMNLLRERGVLLRDGEEAYMLSVDGAQMVDRKESNGWIVLFSCLNTRPSTRFRRQGTFVASVIPGPKNPVNVGSFLYPIMQEFAKASKGHWLWDGNERQRFLWKAYLVFAAADQPGSQKINHMTGTSGFSGCRICHMVANYLPGDGQVTGYFPIKSTGSESDPPINADRPEYDPEELPLRTERSYIDALDELDGCLTRAERAETRKLNGVSSRPLLSASPAFVMPSFFPIDIFHLFGVNLPSLIWDTFTHAKPGNPFTLSEEQTTFFASILKKAGTDLPSSFSSGLPRDPTEFSKSYYKMFEWSLVLYTYLPPFLLAIDAPDQIIEMIDHLQSGVRLASSIHGCSEAQRQQTKHHFIGFCKLWEALYIRDQPDLIYRATISVHYLLHVSDFIWWHGSLIISSQARCEREAGLIKKSVRSHKAVFANILNNVLSREHLRILDIILNDQEAPEPADHFLLTVRHTRTHLNLTQDERTRQEELIQALDNGGGTIVRGKLALPSGHVIRGSRIDSNSRRKACRFMARGLEGTTYAEAIHFMCFDGHRISDGEDAEVNANKVYVLARPLVGVQTGGGLVRGDDFRERLYLVDASTILQPVGILKLGGFIYVLQKLSWLNER